MKDKLGQEPAFPLVYDGDKADSFCHDGISIRLYIATMAMQGILSSGGVHGHIDGNTDFEINVKLSYKYADELLKQENI